MAVHTFYAEECGTPYMLDDDGLVLRADATKAERAMQLGAVLVTGARFPTRGAGHTGL